MPDARGVRGKRRAPRVNAPVQRRRPTGSVADVVITLAFAAMTMAAAFGAVSMTGAAVPEGEAGRELARLFAASLALVGFVTFLLGIALLRENGHIGLRLLYAGALGLLIGIVQTVVFLESPGYLLALPPLFALLAVRYPREWFLRGLGLLPRGDGIR